MTEKNKNENERKGTTVYLDAEAYELIKNKQIEIYLKTKKNVPIQKLVAESVKHGLSLTTVNLLENNKD